MKTGIIFGLFVGITLYALFACKEDGQTPEKQIAQTLTLQVDSFAYSVGKFRKAFESGKANSRELQQLFLQTRLAYKKLEWAGEYFTPTITRTVNGPPVPEVEIGSPQVFKPMGLQVVEGFLYPKYDPKSKTKLLTQLRSLQADCEKYKAYFQNVALFNWQIFDAAKLEAFRVMALGITGFDGPTSMNSMRESAIALNSLRPVFSLYADGNRSDIDQRLASAINYLQANPNFNTFNRARFITDYGNQVTISLTHLQHDLKLPIIKYNRLLNQDAKTLFDLDAFNPAAYDPYLQGIADKKTALGKKLFFDPILSGTGTRSCASCHQPEKAFTDGLVKNTVIKGKTPLARNTPTLINSALQPAQFYDLRAATLDDQVHVVMENKDEMLGSIQQLVNKLWEDKTYRRQFDEAFPEKNRTSIDTAEVMNAIAAFVRSLTLLNSRFDTYMRGDRSAMNTEELNGFNLFMGKAKCATCHYMPIFNGTLPPKYLNIEAEVIGVPKSVNSKVIDPDMGRFGITPLPSFKHAFKIPTLRNITRTAPYMHNGIFKSLKEVVDFYNKGGGAGGGIHIPNQTLPANPLHLTDKESTELISFMNALDSH